MENEKSVTDFSDAPCAPLIPLPIALYESNGLIFENCTREVNLTSRL